MSSHADSPSFLAHQFDDVHQQRTAAALGMWSFLVTEVLFFGGMFAGYTVYRHWYYPQWDHASRELDLLAGTLNTFVLLTSSLTMAMAVDSAKLGRTQKVKNYILWTILLGAVFLGVKAFEYSAKWEHHLVPGPWFHWHDDAVNQGPYELFFSFYFVMTGWHALHMVIGFGLLTALWIQTNNNRFSAEYYTPVELTGLYWHFVDIVWVFLFPLLYLIDRT
jgi:cytochrome c oxidase subunit 3